MARSNRQTHDFNGSEIRELLKFAYSLEPGLNRWHASNVNPELIYLYVVKAPVNIEDPEVEQIVVPENYLDHYLMINDFASEGRLELDDLIHLQQLKDMTDQKAAQEIQDKILQQKAIARMSGANDFLDSADKETPSIADYRRYLLVDNKSSIDQQDAMDQMSGNNRNLDGSHKKR